jgi:hypothetical protein
VYSGIDDIVPNSEQFSYQIASNPEQFDIAKEAHTEPRLSKICISHKQVARGP